MTKGETAKILAVLKAAYPNFYKNLSAQDAEAVITVWTIQLRSIPADIVYMAVTKLIATNRFPPAIAEVKDKLSQMYAEAVSELLAMPNMDDPRAEALQRITGYCADVNKEPKISFMLGYLKGGVGIETHDQ